MSINRRGFFKVVGAGTVAAAAAGCGNPAEKIIPYIVPPENIVPGVASWFSTVCRECPAGCGVMAKNREGRVIKVEGNPDHPVNRGSLCVRGQASMQGLYDPDRVKGPLQRDVVGWKPISWEAAEKLVVEKLSDLRKSGRSGKIAVVSQLETGSLAQLMDQWVKAIGARPRIAYEPFAHEALRAANRLTFGQDTLPHYAFDQAKLVLSFGADFLETWLSPVGQTRDFVQMHARREGKTGTFIHVEPRMSMTAGNADQWIRNAPGSEASLAWALLRVILDERLHKTLAGSELNSVAALTKGVDVESVAKRAQVPAETIRNVARAFAKAEPSLGVGGGVGVTGRDAADLGVAVNLLNYVVGNIGRTVQFGPSSALGKANPYDDMLGLTRAMAGGDVAFLLLAHVNPVFTMPASSGFEKAIEKIPFIVSVSSFLDETTSKAHLILPDLTPLESWGDFSPRDGVFGLMQPAMPPVPLFEGKAFGDLLLSLGRAVLPESAGPNGAFRWESFADYVRENWKTLGKSVAPNVPFESFWEDSLRKGGVWRSVPPLAVKLRTETLAPPSQPPALEGGADGLALLLVPSSRYYDGRGANKSWLHEVPDTMTQLVWDSWIEIPAGTAKKLGMKKDDLVKVSSPHGAIELPAFPSETIHEGCVAIPIGLGHAEYGRFAKGIGANPIVLLPSASDGRSRGLPWLSVKVTLAKTVGKRVLASPAGTTEVDHEREIIETIDLKSLIPLEKKEREEHRDPSMYPEVRYPDHRWGMVIDLDSCNGCQACVVACQAENNVPIVGKAEINYGRGIHWLRVERWWDYGHGEKDGHTKKGADGSAHPPEARFMPMLCQHCGQAPCEPVCPVFAAYHTNEGLNAQVYNRCVGTRYCGNNCPFMVRRFNWFAYERPEPLNWQLNPDVTVREVGVMEKCTFCVQRIVKAKDHAKDEGRKLRDGEVVTACQETCPTQAIVFGDLKDPESRVSKLSRSTRGYHVLGELGTKPAITYLKKVTRGATEG